MMKNLICYGMILKMMKLNLLLLLFIFFSKFSFAAEKTVDPNLIHKNLRCLVCQGQSISDSNSDFAQTIKLVVIDLIEGLILDQKGILFKKEEELIRYSYHVAGTVGIMMCDALKCDNDLAKSFAIDLGIAMQLTNIARDVLEDAKMGRRYLPGSWVQNISPKEIVLAAKTNDLKKLHMISNGIK